MNPSFFSSTLLSFFLISSKCKCSLSSSPKLVALLLTTWPFIYLHIVVWKAIELVRLKCSRIGILGGTDSTTLGTFLRFFFLLSQIIALVCSSTFFFVFSCFVLISRMEKRTVFSNAVTTFDSLLYAVLYHCICKAGNICRTLFTALLRTFCKQT